MEVKIKKSKLTRSLIQQIAVISQQEITNDKWEPIGWCMYKYNPKLFYKLIIFTDNEGGLRRIPMYYNIEDNGDRLSFVTSSSSVANINFTPSTFDEWKDLRTYGWKILESVKDKGQFFI